MGGIAVKTSKSNELRRNGRGFLGNGAEEKGETWQQTERFLRNAGGRFLGRGPGPSRGKKGPPLSVPKSGGPRGCVDPLWVIIRQIGAGSCCLWKGEGAFGKDQTGTAAAVPAVLLQHKRPGPPSSSGSRGRTKNSTPWREVKDLTSMASGMG